MGALSNLVFCRWNAVAGLNNGLTGVSRIPTPYHRASKEQNIVFLRSQWATTTPFQALKRALRGEAGSSNLQILYNNSQYRIVQSLGITGGGAAFLDLLKKRTQGGNRDERRWRLVVYKRKGQIWASTWGNQRPLVWLGWEERVTLGYTYHQVPFSATPARFPPLQYQLLLQKEVRAGFSHADSGGLYQGGEVRALALGPP